MNNNSKKKLHKLTKAQRQTAAKQPRLSTKPKVGGSAKKFATEGVDLKTQAKIFYGACYKEV
jgi:hypothetical protein